MIQRFSHAVHAFREVSNSLGEVSEYQVYRLYDNETLFVSKSFSEAMAVTYDLNNTVERELTL